MWEARVAVGPDIHRLGRVRKEKGRRMHERTVGATYAVGLELNQPYQLRELCAEHHIPKPLLASWESLALHPVEEGHFPQYSVELAAQVGTRYFLPPDRFLGSLYTVLQVELG